MAYSAGSEASVFELHYKFENPLVQAAYQGDPDILDTLRYAGGFVSVAFFSVAVAEGTIYRRDSTPLAERPPFFFACLGMELGFDRDEILTSTTTALGKWLQARGLDDVLPTRVGFREKSLRAGSIAAGQNLAESTTEQACEILRSFTPGPVMDTDLLIEQLLKDS